MIHLKTSIRKSSTLWIERQSLIMQLMFTSSLISWNTLEVELAGSSEWSTAICSIPCMLRGYLRWSPSPLAMTIFLTLQYFYPLAILIHPLLYENGQHRLWDWELFYKFTSLTTSKSGLIFKMAADSAVSEVPSVHHPKYVWAFYWKRCKNVLLDKYWSCYITSTGVLQLTLKRFRDIGSW